MKNFLKENLGFIIFLLVIIVLRVFVISPVEISGASMNPTLADGERIFASKLHNIERFDVVIFDVPAKNEIYVKRVIGMPGDKVEYLDDQLYINGEAYEEDFLEPLRSEYQAVTGDNFTRDYLVEEVPEGYYFLLGDNRRNSVDSRSQTVGFVEDEEIRGEPKLVYWPLRQIRWLD